MLVFEKVKTVLPPAELAIGPLLLLLLLLLVSGKCSRGTVLVVGTSTDEMGVWTGVGKSGYWACCWGWFDLIIASCAICDSMNWTGL